MADLHLGPTRSRRDLGVSQSGKHQCKEHDETYRSPQSLARQQSSPVSGESQECGQGNMQMPNLQEVVHTSIVFRIDTASYRSI